MEIPSAKDIQCIDNALFIEHNVQRIMTQQEITGVQFNETKAHELISIFKERQFELYRRIRPHLNRVLECPYNTPVSKPFLKSGDYSRSVTTWYGDEEIPSIYGPFTRVQFVEPDLRKRKQLLACLISLGWRPRSFTEKGSPKLTVDGEPCKSLEQVGTDVGKWLAEWHILAHRQSQVEGLLKRVRPDGRIAAEAITIGTPTFRMRHKGVVNIPRASSLYGVELRSLFCVKDLERLRLVGYDASGLELRMLAHYINDDDYSQEVVSGDPHTRNQQDAGLADRDTAKTFIYAFIYGAGDAKIGGIAGTNRAGGKRIKTNFLSKNPRLADLIKTTQRAAKRGYLLGLDGRKLFIRKDKFTGELQTHKSLNTILQGAGATVMKWSMVLLDDWIQQYKLDAKKVIDMHDEGQLEVSKKDAELVGVLARQSVITAGELLQLNLPLDAEYKIGTEWSQTH